tara:strand:- start:815 stop:937 length:123 start_codon:yes stop_codon:yes gene_type:complete
MPETDLHKKKKKTNLAIFLTVIGIMALIWAITMIKVSQGG